MYGAAGLVAYSVFSTATSFMMFGPSTNPNRELYPFFTWSLFGDVRDQRVEYSALVTAIDGRIFDEPRDIREIEGFPSYRDSVSLRLKALRAFARGVRSDSPEAADLQAVFQTRYLGRHDVDYMLVRRVYNPIRLWRDGVGGDIEVLGSFSYRGRS